MAEALFIGNGINRLSADSVSWKDVLDELAWYAEMPELMDDADHKPFTLIYEQMSLGSTKRTEKQLKSKVSKRVINFEPNEFHHRIMVSDIQHVMTTNYDYSLQRVGDDHGISANLRREPKYSVFRSRQAEDKRIWHIHGEAEREGSINLGFDQYSGQLQRVRSYAIDDRKYYNFKSPFRSDPAFDAKNKDQPYSWIDVFLRDDVHIIGYSLDYTEFDVWWLITYKEKLRKASKFQVGQTFFHEIISGALSDDKRAKHSLLESLGVQVKLHRYRGSDRSAAYHKALDECLP